MYPFHQKANIKSQFQIQPGYEYSDKVWCGEWKEGFFVCIHDVGIEDNPLSVPTATVKLSIKSKATRAMPAKMAAIKSAANIDQLFKHGMQCELPRDKLSPG